MKSALETALDSNAEPIEEDVTQGSQLLEADDAIPPLSEEPDPEAPKDDDEKQVVDGIESVAGEDEDERKVGVKNKRQYPGGTPNRCTAEQRATLERFLSENSYPSAQRATEIAAIVGMTPKSVKVWFQNARAKQRRLSKANNGNALLFHNMEAPRTQVAPINNTAAIANSAQSVSDLPSLGLLGLNNESIALGLGGMAGMAGLSGMPAMPGLEANAGSFDMGSMSSTWQHAMQQAFPSQDAAASQQAAAMASLLQQAMRNSAMNPMGLPCPSPQWLLQAGGMHESAIGALHAQDAGDPSS
jgi:hypothetical protein